MFWRRVEGLLDGVETFRTALWENDNQIIFAAIQGRDDPIFCIGQVVNEIADLIKDQKSCRCPKQSDLRIVRREVSCADIEDCRIDNFDRVDIDIFGRNFLADIICGDVARTQENWTEGIPQCRVVWVVDHNVEEGIVICAQFTREKDWLVYSKREDIDARICQVQVATAVKQTEDIQIQVGSAAGVLVQETRQDNAIVSAGIRRI